MTATWEAREQGPLGSWQPGKPGCLLASWPCRLVLISRTRKTKPLNQLVSVTSSQAQGLSDNLTHLFHRGETEAQESSISLGSLYQIKTFSFCSDRKPNPKPLKQKKNKNKSILIIEVRRGFLQRLTWYFFRFWCFTLSISRQCSLCSPHARQALFSLWQGGASSSASLHPGLSPERKRKPLPGGKSHCSGVWLPARHSKNGHPWTRT